jgi:hypothetical protein
MLPSGLGPNILGLLSLTYGEDTRVLWNQDRSWRETYQKILKITEFLDFVHCSVFLKSREHIVSSFWNTVFSGLLEYHTTKSKNPVILSVIKHRQNPLESILE